MQPQNMIMGQALAMLYASTANYRRVKPVTDKNIGRNHLKYGRGKYMPHQGTKERARRARLFVSPAREAA